MKEQAKIEILYAEFLRSGMIYVSCLANGNPIDLTITSDNSDFDKFAPKGFEGTLQDGEGEYCAWFDDFNNLHWLIKLHNGFIEHRAVRCDKLIEQMAYEKYTS